MKNKLSVVISAFNEEKKIKDCLESIKWADEIIFIDNTSTDKTADIAKQYTSKIFTRENNLMLNVNKNFGFTKATGDWILNIDADERVASSLRDEIKHQISNINNQNTNGYLIPRQNIIFGKWIKHAGWYPDYQLRLFKNGKGKFEEKHVHELIKLDGKVDYLKENLTHFNFETVSQFLYKHINIYAPNEAENLIRNNHLFNDLDSIRFPLKEFLSRFFAREGYKDGFHGLMLSLFMAFYHFIIFAFLWEKQGFKSYESKDFLYELKKESKNINKELNYWFWEESIRKEKNFMRKILLKIRKRFLLK